MENQRTCSLCGAPLNEENTHEFGGQALCTDCFCDNTVVCCHCGRRIWSDDAECYGRDYLCGGCYDNHYTTCEDCGRIISLDDAYYEEDNDYPYCSTCYHNRHDSSIKNYSYKPTPIFYGEGNLFMGVELEIDGAGEDYDNAGELLDIGNAEHEHIYCKHDGSLCEGFEIVSEPATLSYHMNSLPWKSIFSKAIDMGYSSHNTSTCGLHVHCNRTAFGETYEEQEAAIGRVVFFVEKHWDDLVNFSRRKTENLNRWASRYATISNTTAETYKKAKDKYMGRYVAVNLTNRDTIEFRLFRGTLRYKTFIATLQLVQHICTLATILSDKDFENMSWSKFVLSIDAEDKELIEYLKARRLYVNEETNESEEY